MAGALVAGMQKNDTSVPVTVPHWPVRAIVVPKQGRGVVTHVPAPGAMSSQSLVPESGLHARNF